MTRELDISLQAAEHPAKLPAALVAEIQELLHHHTDTQTAAIADEACAKWLSQCVEAPESDKNADVIADALWGLVQDRKLLIRRGGYVVRRVLVEPAGELPGVMRLPLV
ncbi:MAG: hypothetical protein OXE76_11665 [Alphaproteobacteria bacterium]|nr:hypothetical protein [Alphaproteobacteria bacterium]